MPPETPAPPPLATLIAALTVTALAGCAPDGALGADGAPGPDAGRDGDGRAGDAGDATTPPPDAPAPFTWPSCGTEAFDHFELYYGKAIAVAADGTVFHAMYDAGEAYVSRYRPGQPIERTWRRIGPGSTSVGALAVDPAGTPYALIGTGDQTQLVRLGATLEPLGPALPTISGPTSLAFSPDGILVEASFTGLRRVDLQTGQRTPVSDPIMLREIYFVGARTARGVTYDHGLVELTLDAAAASSTYQTIYPFTTLALQSTGLDQLGRTYAIIHEASNDKVVRFDPTFATRETLVTYPSSSFVFGELAFGRGALRCDVLVTGFSVARVATNDTPGVP